jgi:hypothetical protein
VAGNISPSFGFVILKFAVGNDAGSRAGEFPHTIALLPTRPSGTGGVH